MLLLHVANTSGESMESWDVLVIGSGIAALRSAIAASDAGATVAVIESGGLVTLSQKPVRQALQFLFPKTIIFIMKRTHLQQDSVFLTLQ